ncbi:MAG: glycosyltransferase [Bacteroidaceae bacterium]
MTITFFTNFINHHQVPVADHLYSLLENDYHFVATEKVPQSFLDSGYPDFSKKPYLVKAYMGDNELEKAYQLALDSDVVIIGSAPDVFIEKRLATNKLTFRYSERWFRVRPYYLMSPRGWYNCYKQHLRYRHKELYMLAASAYTANDVYHIGAYKNKTYKWGYFTAVPNLDIDMCLKRKAEKRIKILWCARFLKLKHPELLPYLAQRLQLKGYDFEINMLGSGEEFIHTQELISKLKVDSCVHLLGNVPNAHVLEMMRDHHVFLFTSDKNEGWGAVLNEAMSNGCTVVASNEIGAVPFLVKNGQNGLIFKSKNLDSLEECVESLLKDHLLIEYLAKNAYSTMRDCWSPETATTNFLLLANSLLKENPIKIANGPCSKATPCNAKKL